MWAYYITKDEVDKKNAMLAKAFKATREARAKAIRKSRVREAFMHSTKGYTPLWRGGRGYAPLLLRRASRNAFYRLGYNTLYDHNNNQIAERATLARMLQNKARWKNFRNAVKKLKDNSLSLEGRRKMAAYSKMRRWREGRS